MTEITEQYAYMRACSDDQLHAISLVDNGWRNRNYLYLAQAASVVGRLEPLVMEFPELKLLDYDYLLSGLIEIVSERLMNVLQEQTVLEFFRIVGRHKGQPYINHRFFLMHCTIKIPALDRHRSVYTEYSEAAGGGIKSVQKIVLDEQLVGNRELFLLTDPGIYCISNRLVSKLRGQELKGVEFVSLAEYSDF